MSFVFPSWETAFSPAFHESAKAMLEGALNKGNKPPVIQGRIEVVELSMGTVPPTLTLLEIGDLSMDRFRGILRLGYAGDAWLEVRCRVQANPLSHNPHLAPSSTLPLSTPLLASQPLLVPMTLRLSKLHLRAILILVVSQSKGITLVFKNDPLQNVDVSSTFDSIEVIRGYLQQEIEGQLREMFREDLPGIIHRLSQQWFAGAGTGGRVEMPYRDREEGAASIAGQTDQEDTEEDDSPFSTKPLFPPHPSSTSTSGLSSSPNRPTTPRRRSMVNQTSQPSFRNRRSSNPAAPPISSSPSAYTTFPDIEDYDPTYGLRPEGVPTHSGYEAFGRLWEKAREGGRGLGSLMREPIGEGALLEEDEDEMEHMEQDDWAPSRHEGDVSDLEDDLFTSNAHGRSGDVDDELDAEAASVDVVDPRLLLRRMDSRRSTQSGIDALSRNGAGYVHGHGPEDEFDTFPAVGGGFITRPRVYHAQSQIVIRGPGGTPASAASDVGAANSPAGTAGTGSVTARAASSVAGASSTIGSLRQITPQRRPMGSSASVGNGLAGFSGATPGPGPTTLRRMTTSRSDVFLSRTAQGPGIASPSPARRGPSASVSYASFNPLLAHAINGRMSQQNGGPSRRQSAAAQSRSRPRPTSVHANIPSGPMYGSSGARMVMSPPGSSYRSGHAGAAQPANRSSRSGTYSTVGSNSHSHPQSYSQMPSSRSMSIPTPSSDIGRSPSKQSAIGGGRQRASSVANGFTGLGGSPSSFPPRQSLQAGLAGITLPPLNNSVSQLATLSHSAQTLSPYARAHEHVAVRSFPYGLQHASHAGAGPGSGSGTGTGSGSAVGVGRGNVGLGMVMGSDLSGPTYGNGQSAGSVSGKGDGRVGRVLGRAGAMVYASQVQRERYEESKAAYANGGDAVKGVRKRYYDFSKRGKADTQAGTADGVQSRRSSPGELDEGDMARLSIKPEGRMGQAAGSAKTPGAELARPKIRERVSYGFPKV